MTHEEVVEGGANPGGQAGRHVGPGQPGDRDGVPGQHPGDHAPYEYSREGVGEDVDGLVVPVGQTGDAAQGVEGRAVVRVDILVEPQVSRHVTVQQQLRGPPCSTHSHLLLLLQVAADKYFAARPSQDIHHGNIVTVTTHTTVCPAISRRYSNINKNWRRLILILLPSFTTNILTYDSPADVICLSVCSILPSCLHIIITFF